GHMASGAAAGRGGRAPVLPHGGLHEGAVLVAVARWKAELVTAGAAAGAAEIGGPQRSMRRRPGAPPGAAFRAGRGEDSALLGHMAADAADAERAHLSRRLLRGIGLGGVAALAERARLHGEGRPVRGICVRLPVARGLPLDGLLLMAGDARGIES